MGTQREWCRLLLPDVQLTRSILPSPQSPPKPMDGTKGQISHRRIAQFTEAHGVFDVNKVAWCPRAGLEDVFATAGDDGCSKVWKVAQI